MAGERVVPGLGGLIQAFWTVHSDGWAGDMDNNLRALAAVTQLSVLSRQTALPGSPSDGDIHIITAGGDANKVAIRDNGAWVLFTPVEGWSAWDRATNEPLRFDGSTWTIAAAGLVDAPADGTTYGREDNAWVNVLKDAPSDGESYVRKDGAWESLDDAFDGVAEAPEDTVPYVRLDAAWQSLPDWLDDEGYVVDAPGDGTYYGRRNEAWTNLDLRYLQDAPSDGDFYARKDGAWAIVPTAPTTDTYDFVVAGKVTASGLVKFIVAREFDMPDNLAGSKFSASANATADTVFSIKRNGAAIGTATIAAGTQTCTFATTGGGVETWEEDDTFEVESPASPDATLADPVFTFVATRDI